jgi:DNA topoisomerase-6 subunit B
LNRFANKVPLLYEEGACAITKELKKITWRSYGLSNSSGSMPSGPAIIVVHMASVWVPFTSESKASVASYPDINKELRLAIQECARSLQVYVKRKQKSALEEEKRQKFRGYSDEVSKAVAKLTLKDSYKADSKQILTVSDKIRDSLLKTAESMYSSGKNLEESEEEENE